MSRIEEVKEALIGGQPLFYAETNTNFRKLFIQRWYSDMKRRHKRRVRAVEGTYEGQTGSFVWSEEVK